MSRPLLIVSTSYPESADGSEAAGSFVADFATAAARHVPVCVVAPGRSRSTSEVRGTLRMRPAASTYKSFASAER